MDEEITEKICSIPLPLYNKNDSLCWGLNANGNFSVKSATWIQNSMISDDLKDLLKRMWKFNIPNKVNIFSWLLILIQNKLQTRSKIHRFINTISDTCLLCNVDLEDQNHYFINYECAPQVWNFSPKVHPPVNQNSCSRLE